MIYKQLAYIPVIFQVDEGIFLNIPGLLEKNNFFFNKILIVSGRSYSYNYALQLKKMNGWECFVLENNTHAEVERLKSFCEIYRCDLIVAIGGGKVLDIVKRVSYLININHLSIPTTISNDGLISPISVIKNHTEVTESLPGQMPMGVIIDLDIIQSSPVKYLQAAAGDILTNLSATNDWILSAEHAGDRINDLAFLLSRSSATSLLNFNNIDFSYKPFIRQIVTGQLNSGIAMSLAGTSRPCSGSEHLISHAIDYLGLSADNLHGTQVASVSIFSLFLQKKLNYDHLKYMERIGAPLLFHELNAEILENLQEIFFVAKRMRPGRFTVLELLTADAFLNAYNDFQEFISDFAVSNAK